MNPPIVSFNFRYIWRWNKCWSCLLYRFRRGHALCWRAFRRTGGGAFDLRCHQRRCWHTIPRKGWRRSLSRGFPKINAFNHLRCDYRLTFRRARRRHYTLRTRPRPLYRLGCRSCGCCFMKLNELARRLASGGVTGDRASPRRGAFGTNFCCPLLRLHHRSPGV